jgi:hypothetical protein
LLPLYFVDKLRRAAGEKKKFRNTAQHQLRWVTRHLETNLRW